MLYRHVQPNPKELHVIGYFATVVCDVYVALRMLVVAFLRRGVICSIRHVSLSFEALVVHVPFCFGACVLTCVFLLMWGTCSVVWLMWALACCLPC